MIFRNMRTWAYRGFFGGSALGILLLILFHAGLRDALQPIVGTPVLLIALITGMSGFDVPGFVSESTAFLIAQVFYCICLGVIGTLLMAVTHLFIKTK